MHRNFVEERMPERGGERDPFGRVVLEHLVDQVEQQVVVLDVAHAVFLKMTSSVLGTLSTNSNMQ